MDATKDLLAGHQIEKAIRIIRGHKVLLDSELAALYQVEIKALTRAVRRNIVRFPGDFMFELTAREHCSLRRQLGTLETGRGRYRKYPPMAFTEQGVAMLSGVLRSPRAVAVNIEIMRAVVRLRRYLATHHDLARRPPNAARSASGPRMVDLDILS